MSAAAHSLDLTARKIAALSAHIRALAGDDDEAWLDTLDGSCDAVGAARTVVRQIIETAAQADALKAVVATYSERKKALEAREDRLRGALLRFLSDLGERGMALPEATLSVVRGRPTIVGEPDPETLPDALVRVKREADRTAILAALLDNKEVTGCSLSNGAPRLTVRVK